MKKAIYKYTENFGPAVVGPKFGIYTPTLKSGFFNVPKSCLNNIEVISPFCEFSHYSKCDISELSKKILGTKFIPVLTDKIPYAAVKFGRNNKKPIVYFNKDFLKELTYLDYLFVLYHEIAHTKAPRGLYSIEEEIFCDESAANVLLEIGWNASQVMGVYKTISFDYFRSRNIFTKLLNNNKTW